jgi:hypothetical protein
MHSDQLPYTIPDNVHFLYNDLNEIKTFQLLKPTSNIDKEWVQMTHICHTTFKIEELSLEPNIL